MDSRNRHGIGALRSITITSVNVDEANVARHLGHWELQHNDGNSDRPVQLAEAVGVEMSADQVGVARTVVVRRGWLGRIC